MQDVNIYLAGSIRGPARKSGGYVYVLECFRNGKAVTLQKGKWLDDTTENQLALLALSDALTRLNCPCNLSIYTDCQHIINAMQNHWARQWQKNNWVNARGNQVKNADQWKEVLERLDSHTYTFSMESHTYTEWMRTELDREKEKHRKK